jgi:hypothetical protein
MVLYLVCHESLTPETVCFDLNDLVEGFSVFYTTGNSVVEGCPWWNWWPLFQSLWRTLVKGALG